MHVVLPELFLKNITTTKEIADMLTLYINSVYTQIW